MNLLNEELIYEIKLSANYKAFTVFYNGDINFLKILTAAKSKKNNKKTKKKRNAPELLKRSILKLPNLQRFTPSTIYQAGGQTVLELHPHHPGC